ncbi:hypothetical protein D3C80_1333260 [compost metagenome]
MRLQKNSLLPVSVRPLLFSMSVLPQVNGDSIRNVWPSASTGCICSGWEIIRRITFRRQFNLSPLWKGSMSWISWMPSGSWLIHTSRYNAGIRLMKLLQSLAIRLKYSLDLPLRQRLRERIIISSSGPCLHIRRFQTCCAAVSVMQGEHMKRRLNTPIDMPI